MRNMNIKNNKKHGFTLVEIIVVLVILAVLAAAAIPTMLGYIKKSRAAICVNDRGVMRRAYQTLSAGKAYNISDPKPLLDILVKDFDGELIDETHYKSKCGGNCTITYKGGNYSLIEKIECDIHGDGSGDGVSGLVGTEYAERGILELIKDKDNKISDYFDKFGSDKSYHLDSTGFNTGPVVNDILEEAGFDKDSCSWRIYRNIDYDTYEIYWTNINISSLSVGDSVSFSKMTVSANNTNIQTDKFGNPISDSRQSGVTVISTNVDNKKTFNVLTPSSAVYDENYGDSWGG